MLSGSREMTTTNDIKETTVFQRYVEGIKSKETKKMYIYQIDYFLDFLGHEKNSNTNREKSLSVLLEHQPRDIENALISYIVDLKKQGYAWATINNKVAAVLTFFEINDIILNKRKIHRYMPEHIKTVKDRAYTREEIQKIIANSPLKFKVVVTLMASTGCRVGAIPPLRILDLIYLKQERLHQIAFYAGTKDEYYSFTTPECSKYINEYLEFRERCGEKIKPSNPFIRNDFQQDDLLQAENPRPQTTHTFKFQIRKILIQSGIRERLTQEQLGSKKKGRRDIAANHGFRKFVHTVMANSKVAPEVREMLLGHSIGLSDAYYRPTEKEMLLEFLKVVNDLTINDENRLKSENQKLTEESDYKEYVIQQKLKQKDLEIEKMQDQIKQLTEAEKNKTDFTKEEKEYLRNIITKVGWTIGPEAHEYTKKFVQCHYPDGDWFDDMKKWEDLCDMERNFFQKNVKPALKKYSNS